MFSRPKLQRAFRRVEMYIAKDVQKLHYAEGGPSISFFYLLRSVQGKTDSTEAHIFENFMRFALSGDCFKRWFDFVENRKKEIREQFLRCGVKSELLETYLAMFPLLNIKFQEPPL